MSGEIESVERREFLEAGKRKRALEESCEDERKTKTQEPSRFPDMNTSPTLSPPAHQHYEAHQGKDPHFMKFCLKGKGKQIRENPGCPGLSRLS